MPFWLTVLLAAIPIGISFASLVVALSARRIAGPVVRVDAVYGPSLSGRKITAWDRVLTVTVTNRGRGSVTIDLLGVEYLVVSYAAVISPGIPRMLKARAAMRWAGPDRPHRLSGDDVVEWTEDLSNVLFDLNADELLPSHRLAVAVRIGGRVSRYPVRIFGGGQAFDVARMGN